MSLLLSECMMAVGLEAAPDGPSEALTLEWAGSATHSPRTLR
jgi:hypothetical protein